MNLPRVSIIIPTFKRPETLSRAIDSVLNQTYQNIEIIVVDDNDPSSKFRQFTEKVMDKYKENEKIKYIKHLENMNGAAARNTGIKSSDGNYIAFLDDDDEFLFDKIEKQVIKLESLDSSWGACYTSYKKLNPNNKIQYSGENREGYLYKEALMRSIYLGSGSNLLVRRNVVEKIGGFDESFRRNQDIEFLVRITKEFKLAYIDTCSLIVHYEIRENKMTYEQLVELDKQYIQKFQPLIDGLLSKDKMAVYTMITLDNFRYSIYHKCIIKGIRALLKNRTKLLVVIRFIGYLIKRVISNKSYGFEIN